MKKRLTTWMMLAIFSASAVFMTACSEEKKPESITVGTNAVMLASEGATYDLNEEISIEPEEAQVKLTFTSSDEAIVQVSEDGVLTAVDFGTAVITVDVLDSDLSASVDVAVCNLYGEYSATKTIEAMNCDITVNMILNTDGTYSYYRAPMNSSMTNDETGLEDAGTYEINGSEIVFTGENLGEFTLTMTMDYEGVVLSGKIPTGGPSTDMTLNRVQGE